MNRPKIPLERKLIRRVLKGQTDPEQLARALRVPLEDVAQWMVRPRTGQLIRGLRLLGDSYSQLQLSQRRVAGVERLAKMVQDGEGCEPLRRACSDLLKGHIAQLPDSPADEPPAQPQHNSRKEELLRKAMGLIGSGKVALDDPRCPSLPFVEHR